MRLTPILLLSLSLCGALPGWPSLVSAQPTSQPQTAEKQVVLQTSEGELVLEVFPDAAPAHVEAFLSRIESGFYRGTTFHRAIARGIIQGGDPLSRDPEKREEYGTGGLNEREAEFNSVSHVAGTVSAVLVPGKTASGGAQFFICVSDQTQLDGQYTAFARVVEGLEVVERISLLPVDEEGNLRQRVDITGTSLRERPPPEMLPFAEASVQEMAATRAVVKTNLGEFEIQFFPEIAPEHVRQFLRFSELGIYDGSLFHRVVPGFVVQGGSVGHRKDPLPQKLARHLQPLQAEFSERPHLRGVVSMARGEDPDSAVDSFFVVLQTNPHLDGKYTVFGEVIRGLDVVDGIAQAPTRGETPIFPVVIESIALRR